MDATDTDRSLTSGDWKTYSISKGWFFMIEHWAAWKMMWLWSANVSMATTQQDRPRVFFHFSLFRHKKARVVWEQMKKLFFCTHSNRLKRSVPLLPAKHFDTSLSKMTGRKDWNRRILEGFNTKVLQLFHRGQKAQKAINVVWSMFGERQCEICSLSVLVHCREVTQLSPAWKVYI